MITALPRHPLETHESTVSPGDIDPRQLIPAAGLINKQRVAVYPARMKLLHCSRRVAQSRAGGQLLSSLLLQSCDQYVDILHSHI